jgi:hypothetical protein
VEQSLGVRVPSSVSPFAILAFERLVSDFDGESFSGSIEPAVGGERVHERKIRRFGPPGHVGTIGKQWPEAVSVPKGAQEVVRDPIVLPTRAHKRTSITIPARAFMVTGKMENQLNEISMTYTAGLHGATLHVAHPVAAGYVFIPHANIVAIHTRLRNRALPGLRQYIPGQEPSPRKLRKKLPAEKKAGSKSNDASPPAKSWEKYLRMSLAEFPGGAFDHWCWFSQPGSEEDSAASIEGCHGNLLDWLLRLLLVWESANDFAEITV